MRLTTPPAMPRDRGFSFIELLAYMAIAALLILAAVPQFGSFRARAHDTNVQTDLHSFAKTIEAQKIDAQAAPTTPAAITDLHWRPTRSAYDLTSNAVIYCQLGDDYGMIAKSKSGRAWSYTGASGVQRFTAIAYPSRAVDSCAALAAVEKTPWTEAQFKLWLNPPGGWHESYVD